MGLKYLLYTNALTSRAQLSFFMFTNSNQK